MTSFTNIPKNHKGPFKYYVIKEMGGRGGQMMMFDDKVGGWGWLNADVSKKYTRKKNFFCVRRKKGLIFLKKQDRRYSDPKDRNG